MASLPPRPPTALVIDDQAIVRDLLGELLRYLGFETQDATSGTEGLAVFEERPVDLVVTDLVMPGISGWEVVAAVRQRAPATGIVLATASVSNLDLDRLRELNVTLLAKPFQLDGLRRAVAQALSAVRVSATAAIEAPGEGAQPLSARSPAPGEGLSDPRVPIAALRDALTRLEAVLEAVEGLLHERETLLARLASRDQEERDLRGAHDRMRRELHGIGAALVQLQRDHTVLQRDFAATGRTLDELRAQDRAWREERQALLAELETIARRLRGDP